jgi:prepilin-type N-terminal cleavage/methylation domain-containing protein
LRGRFKWLAGFTLVELLVVLAIITILAAMFLPVLARAKGLGRQAYCANNLRQHSISLTLYSGDTGFYPFCLQGDTWWYAAIGLKWTNGAGHCPMYGGTIGAASGSYGYNFLGTGTAGNNYGLGDGMHAGSEFIKSTWVKPLTYAILDARGTVRPDGSWNGLPFVAPWGLGGEEAQPYRHGKALKAVSCDGHVESVPHSQIRNLPVNDVAARARWNHDGDAHIKRP